jgi:hypothetical protein
MGTNKYQQITEARNLLELPERASMEEIKSNYRNLIRQDQAMASGYIERNQRKMHRSDSWDYCCV